MSSPVFRSVWGLGSKLDPIGHKAVEGIVRVDGLAAERTGKITGLNGLESEWHKNHSEPVRGAQIGATAAAIYFGGAALAGGYGGSTSAEGAGASGLTDGVAEAAADGAAESSGADWSRLAQKGIQSQQQPDPNAARRQSLQMMAASLRQQIAALRSETANESPATLGDTQPSFQ